MCGSVLVLDDLGSNGTASALLISCAPILVPRTSVSSLVLCPAIGISGVIQGDGINKDTVRSILTAALDAGYSAQCVAFGMGGGLLQKVNRDTMGFATKLAYMEYADGRRRDIMKLPKTDSGKVSLPGVLRVQRDADTGLELVFPRHPDDDSYTTEDVMRVVYDCKPLQGVWDDFATIRKRAETEWNRAPKLHDPISAPLKQKTAEWIARQRALLAKGTNVTAESIPSSVPAPAPAADARPKSAVQPKQTSAPVVKSS